MLSWQCETELGSSFLSTRSVCLKCRRPQGTHHKPKRKSTAWSTDLGSGLRYLSIVRDGHSKGMIRGPSKKGRSTDLGSGFRSLSIDLGGFYAPHPLLRSFASSVEPASHPKPRILCGWNQRRR